MGAMGNSARGVGPNLDQAAAMRMVDLLHNLNLALQLVPVVSWMKLEHGLDGHDCVRVIFAVSDPCLRKGTLAQYLP